MRQIPGHDGPAMMAALERARPAGAPSGPLPSTAMTLKRLAVRYRHLTLELAP
jgi:transposase